jgi:D-glycero-alpha-D-manno-heptose-7-phosphate kinase
MIIARTPFRISFAGGGSDLRAYFRHRAGAVVSTAIKRYMHVIVNQRFDNSVRVAYTKTEIVGCAGEVRHDLVREAMRHTGVETGVEIATIADVPAGTGLGSSSSLTVGLLHSLCAYQGRFRSPEQLARDACHIETEVLGRPIGKQDQYAAAYGGINYIQFNPDETVFVQPVICPVNTRRELEERLLMFYIAARDDNSTLLEEQQQRTTEDAQARAILDCMVRLAQETRDALQRDDLDSFGALLEENWILKKRMHPGMSTPHIDRWYALAREAGALGGKILGTGGAGFLLMFCAKGMQAPVRAVLEREGLRYFPAEFDPEGSKVSLISAGE